jgi:PhnB protein
MDLVTYLSFEGRCEEAFKHYERVLGGTILAMFRYRDAPPDVLRPEGAEHYVMHARLRVGDRLLMGGDAPVQQAGSPQGFCVSIIVPSPDDAERIFAGLSEGGIVTMPMAETFWAHRFGMLTDRFGIPWMVNCEKPLSTI